MSATGTSILAEGVTIRGAGGRAAVRDVSLTAGSGTLTAVAGPGRSGRTSLLLALAGRMAGVRGTIRLDRRAGDGRGSSTAAPAPTPPAELRRRVAVARALGQFEPDHYARVGELLRAAGVYAGHRVTEGDVDAALGAVGLATGSRTALDPGTPYGLLHPHDRMLLAVALALAGRPEAVVVDGADSGLDDASRARAWAALRAAATRGTTLVASCDSAAEARTHGAHRVVELAHPADRGDV